jgi:hypothetical protein
VDVEFQLGTSAETLAALAHREVELVEPIVDDGLVLVTAPTLWRTRRRPGQLDDLLWVHREEGSATRVALEAALRAIGAAPRRRLALPSWEAITLVVATAVRSPRSAGWRSRSSRPPARSSSWT